MTDNDVQAEIERREEEFERIFDAHEPFGPLNDDEFLKQAIQIFCVSAFKDEPIIGVAQKAARALAIRLLQPPDDEKNWRVTLPCPDEKKETMLTEKQKKSRSIAFEVCSLILAGEKMTHAAAQVAARRHVSTQKVNGDYYEYRRDFAAVRRLTNPGDDLSKFED
ncbi:hypothetical protein [Paraburkholderia atlantica]|uniref:hypothetical protein n=1 Tax=Paraburkholderia atlantica TaxID=2654982 RepID=UPI00161B613B|nr:hypothetical protein [Paraburkholderia atlantica]MBB5506703.1 hypothetical protein [Paraburkholderia atlantica]